MLDKHVIQAIRIIRIIDILSDRERNRCVSAKELATELRRSTSYMDAMLGRLSAAGIVTGIRGPHGGYLNNIKYDDITIYDVAQAVGSAREPGGFRYSEYSKNVKIFMFVDFSFPNTKGA